MKKVLVAGATGYLGGFVVKAFRERGYWVRALARSEGQVEALREHVNETFVGTATDPDSLKEACEGIDILFSSIGITKQKEGLTYMDVDYQANLNLLEEAREAGVSKFIYVSVFNAEKMKHLKVVQAKTRFEEALKQSGLDYLIVYPNGFFSDMLEYLQMAQRGRGYVFGSGEYGANPIHGEDLAEACVDEVASGEPELHIGGPDILTHNEILSLAFESVQRKAKISRIPIWVRDLVLATLRAVTPVKVYGPLEFFMTVLAMDMDAPTYGKHHLVDFFAEHAGGSQEWHHRTQCGRARGVLEM